jgi:hypothetical protein
VSFGKSAAQCVQLFRFCEANAGGFSPARKSCKGNASAFPELLPRKRLDDANIAFALLSPRLPSVLRSKCGRLLARKREA